MLHSQRNRPDDHQRYRFDERGAEGRTVAVVKKNDPPARSESRPSFFARVQEFHAAKCAQVSKA